MADTIHTTTEALASLFAVETAYGTEVAAATVKLGSITMNPSPKTTSKKLKPKGQMLPTAIAVQEEVVDISFDGEATYEDAKSLISDVVSDALASDIPSMTVTCGGMKCLGAVITGWTLKGDNAGIQLSGSMVAKSAAPGAQTFAGTQNAATGMLNAHVTISIGGSNVASSSVDQVFNWAVSVANMWGPNRFVGSNQIKTVTQKEMDCTFTLEIEKNTASEALLADKTKKAVVITITDATKTCSLSFDAMLDTPETFADHDGIYGFGLKYAIVNKATAAIDITHTP